MPTYAKKSKYELTQCGYPNHIIVATKDGGVAIINRQSLYYSTAKKKKIALQGQVFDTYEDAIMAIKETKPYQDPRGQWRRLGDLANLVTVK